MNIQYALELFGTFAFAISGALAVSDKGSDWFGAGFTGFATAIGGGTLRDMMLDNFPLSWIKDVNFLYAILAGIICTFVLYKILLRLKKTLLLFDTIGIALFTIVGTEKAIEVGVSPEIAAIMGFFTAVMGGVIRDTLTNEIPVIFRKEIYASACLAGAVVYLVCMNFGMDREINFILSSSIIAGIRLIAVKYNLSLPGARTDIEK